jgi:hypothetical protein
MYSPFEVKRRFGEACRLQLHGRRREMSLLFASCWFLTWFILQRWRERRLVPPKRRSTFNWVKVVIPKKTKIFITTAASTSNPTFIDNYSVRYSIRVGAAEVETAWLQMNHEATCSSWFFARGFFYPEDGGDTILRNVGSIDHIYRAPHPRRRHCS